MPAPPRASSPRFQYRALAGDVSDKLKGSLPCQEGQGVLKPASPRAPPWPARATVLPARLGVGFVPRRHWVEVGETPDIGVSPCPGLSRQSDPHPGGGLSPRAPHSRSRGHPSALWSRPGDPPAAGVWLTPCAQSLLAPRGCLLQPRGQRGLPLVLRHPTAHPTGAPGLGSPRGPPHGYPGTRLAP